jgi:hypothetical protein
MLVFRRVVLTLIVMGCLWDPTIHAQTALPLQEAVSNGT